MQPRSLTRERRQRIGLSVRGGRSETASRRGLRCYAHRGRSSVRPSVRPSVSQSVSQSDRPYVCASTPKIAGRSNAASFSVAAPPSADAVHGDGDLNPRRLERRRRRQVDPESDIVGRSGLAEARTAPPPHRTLLPSAVGAWTSRQLRLPACWRSCDAA